MQPDRGAEPEPLTRLAVTGEKGRTTAIDPYLEALWDRGGTDLLLTADAPPMLRVGGQLDRYAGPDLTPDDIDAIVTGLVGPALRQAFDSDGEVDFSFSWRGQARFRGNAFRQRHTTALSLRLIPFKIPTFDELAIPHVIRDFMNRTHGLVLVTGPTGSGKSTTLAAMLDFINENRACHIVTVEDPIEYLHHHKRSAVNQREIGEDSASFPRALRSVLREDPDVVLIGEMRDPESIQAALTIAETGHLVFATLHTNDSSQAVDRIVDVFPADRRPQIQVQLSHVLACVVYQRLLPRADRGLVAAFEIMIGNHAVRNLIREGKTRQLRNVVSTHQAEGMQTLEMSLAQLVSRGLVSADAAAGVSLFPREIALPPARENGRVLAPASR
jgi:twitching motility protein PilT